MVSDFKTFTNNGCKIAAQKSLFWGEFCLTEQDFLISVFLTTFNGFLAPISRSPMSKLLKFSEFLGKSYGKKRSKIKKKIIFHKGCKIAAQKKGFFFPENVALIAVFFSICATIRIGWAMLCLPYAGFLKRVLNTTRLVRHSSMM